MAISQTIIRAGAIGVLLLLLLAVIVYLGGLMVSPPAVQPFAYVPATV